MHGVTDGWVGVLVFQTQHFIVVSTEKYVKVIYLMSLTVFLCLGI